MVRPGKMPGCLVCVAWGFVILGLCWVGIGFLGVFMAVVLFRPSEPGFVPLLPSTAGVGLFGLCQAGVGVLIAYAGRQLLAGRKWARALLEALGWTGVTGALLIAIAPWVYRSAIAGAPPGESMPVWEAATISAIGLTNCALCAVLVALLRGPVRRAMDNAAEVAVGPRRRLDG